MPEADDNTSVAPPSATPANPAGPPAELAGPPTDGTGPAGDSAEADTARYGGLSWSWEMDFDALVTALSEPAPWNLPAQPAPAQPVPAQPVPVQPAAPGTSADSDTAACTSPADSVSPAVSAPDDDPVEAEFAELLEAVEQSRSHVLPLAVVAGRVAESLPTGPDLAGWLATSPVAELEDGALAGMAASYRRLASWAQAGELAIIAQLAARSAAADKKIGTGKDGRPVQLPDEACAQVSLALTMSQSAASWWSDLAVTLTWRLPATGAALRAGQIDLGRARLIAEATAALDEDKARAVEAKVLPTAGDLTTGQLRAALRRAVITADPEGAERRREEAERRARVSLYPDPEGTASLAGYSLPSIRAAAAMARISALAQAMKASGAGGGIDLLRAQVFLGLLLGTLPYIPPAEGGPPDVPPDGPGEPDDPGEPGDQPGEPPADQPDEPPGEPPADQPDEPLDSQPDSPDGQPGGRAGDRSQEHSRQPRPGDLAPADPPSSGGGSGSRGSAPPKASECAPDHPPPNPPPKPEPELPRADPVPPGPAPPDEEDLEPDGLPPWDGRAESDGESDWLAAAGPPPAWPQVLPVLAPGPAAMANLRPAGGGLLDLTVPWSTLMGDSGEPGQLTRIGPITPAQACHLADLAAADPGVSWRVVLTGSDGRALAVSRVPKRRGVPELRGVPKLSGSGDRVAGGGQASLIRQVTVIISVEHATSPPPAGLPVMLERTRRAGVAAAENARLRATADAAAGGCAHDLASSAYAAPPRLRDFITARDGTCRFPTCRQPVWRCDLDHSIPYHKGGKTCSCNLGGLCRYHHMIKQHNFWQLAQAVPGTFAWTTPAGRTYYAQPDQHAA